MAQTKQTTDDNAKGGRAASLENKHGLACPECFGVPDTIRNDGISTARHERANPRARKFRDTQFCNGQGRQGRHVIDKAWKPGTKPEHSISAREFLEHGTAKFEERQQRKAEKAQRTANASKNAKSPKSKGGAKKGAKGGKAKKASA